MRAERILDLGLVLGLLCVVGLLATNCKDDTRKFELTRITLPVSLNGGSDSLAVRPLRETPNRADIGVFESVCKPSHASYDDPVLAPDRPGHGAGATFAGNTLTSAYTQQSTLSLGESTCRGGLLDSSAYWMPAIVLGAEYVAPDRLRALWRRVGASTAFPPALVTDRVTWLDKHTLVAKFQSCSDGLGHLAFREGAKCPADLPIEYLELELREEFDAELPAEVLFPSWAGVIPSISQELVSACFEQNLACVDGRLPDNKEAY